MTEEELKERMDKDLAEVFNVKSIIDFHFDFLRKTYTKGLETGMKVAGPQWHKVAAGDLPKGDEGYGETSIYRKIYLKDRDGNLYTGRYYPKDDCHPEDCFAVEFLDWGLQGSHFCAKVQISEWCEIHTFDKE